MHSNPEHIAQRLLAWNGAGLRQTFPWQHTGDAYCVWVSEIMLQQTRAETVIPYYQRFMRTFPDIPLLAAADESEVLRLWSGLGYYSRARNLHRGARALVEGFGGILPTTVEELLSLPGIGRSTAGAICALGHGGRGVILDGNVRRVLSRLYAVDGDPARAATQRELWRLADECTPAASELAGDYAQAIMNFGAVVCKSRRPDCDLCPLRTDCEACRQSRQEQLPMRRRRAVRPVRQARWLVLRFPDDGVLLERVGIRGVWSRLWTLPEPREGETLQQACVRLTGLAEGQWRTRAAPWREVRHGFTHFELCAEVHVAEADKPPARIAEPQRWFVGSPAEALHSLALPSPVSRLLAELQEQE